MSPAPRLEFFDTAEDFLAVAGDQLAANPVVSTVVASVASMMAQPHEEPARPYRPWFLVVRDEDGAVVGTGMRTAPYPPYPAYLLPMPDAAAVALARTLYERGEQPVAVNGALPTVQIFADELARLGGGRVEFSLHTRLHELGTLVEPDPVPGRLVNATEDDLDLVGAWFAAFMGEADEQAGRPPGSTAHETPDRAELLRRIRTGRLWLWVDETGERVHLTGCRETSFGVARVGPVYTPPSQRGRGWASNAVAEVSRRLRAEGARVCLFTDQANPTSNKIYLALGYHPVVDMANLAIVP